MTKKILANKVLPNYYLIQGRVPKALESKYDEWRKIRNLPLGKEGKLECFKVMLNTILEETSFLSKELIEKLDNVFIEGSYKEKVDFIVDRYVEWNRKFPYLVIQRPITPEDAGFLPLPCVKAIYWEGKFLGFQCIIRKPPIDLPRISLKDSEGHRITLKITTPDLCLTCFELCKKQKIGLDLFSHIKLEDVEIYKEARLKSDRERPITERLKKAGIRISVQKAKKLFEYMTYDEKTRKWKRITKASHVLDISRPTIYKLIEIFPEGVR